MTVENISWSISLKRVCQTWRGRTRDLLFTGRTSRIMDLSKLKDRREKLRNTVKKGLNNTNKKKTEDNLSLNLFMSSWFFYFNSWDRSISSWRKVWLVFNFTIVYRNSCTRCRQCRPWSDAAFYTVFQCPFIGTLCINGVKYQRHKERQKEWTRKEGQKEKRRNNGKQCRTIINKSYRLI